MGLTWAHPRSRGENAYRDSPARHGSGSSPLTRGKPSTATARPTRNGAHPRSRGENKGHCLQVHCGSGSSPLTRGKHPNDPGAWRYPGLIPAHAGKTLVAVTPSIEAEAHPRSRGENRMGSHQDQAPDGSSPLTRGKLWVAGAGEPSEGLIPAHAGKTRNFFGC